jgi:peptidyl-prolyl cis-trans isomerase B (cyclophilin B)
MKRLPTFSAAVFGAFLLAGCSRNSDEKVIRDSNELNKKTAAAVAKADDLAGLKAAMTEFTVKNAELLKGVSEGFAKREKEIFNQFKGKQLSREQAIEKVQALEQDQKTFFASFDKKTKESLAALEKAADPLHKKLTEGPNPVVLLETSMGPIKVELYEKLAPATVKNILQYVDDKFYDGTIFHRVIPDFMVQGGGFEPGMTEKKTGENVENESYNLLRNERGTLAMARTPKPHSASAQFFVNVKDNSFLNRTRASDAYGYTVFGRVLEGMDVVDKICQVPTTTKDGHEAVPREDVTLKSARRVEAKKG